MPVEDVPDFINAACFTRKQSLLLSVSGRRVHQKCSVPRPTSPAAVKQVRLNKSWVMDHTSLFDLCRRRCTSITYAVFYTGLLECSETKLSDDSVVRSRPKPLCPLLLFVNMGPSPHPPTALVLTPKLV